MEIILQASSNLRDTVYGVRLHSDFESGNLEIQEPRLAKINGLKCVKAGGVEGCDGGIETEIEVSEVDHLQMGVDCQRQLAT
jgi:hypothetical protein